MKKGTEKLKTFAQNLLKRYGPQYLGALLLIVIKYTLHGVMILYA